MNKELANKLKNKYPQIFRDLWGDPQKTCMAIGIECGDGWFAILDKLCEDIMALQPGYLFKFDQVKEKFAGLRVYFSCHKDKWQEVSGLVSKAEEESYCVCEECGSKENVNLVGFGWIKTLCDKCRGDKPVRDAEFTAAVRPKRKVVEGVKKDSEFFLTWYASTSDDFLDEEKLGVTEDQIKQWFSLASVKETHDCLIVRSTQKNYIQPFVKHEIDLNKFNYFVECRVYIIT